MEDVKSRFDVWAEGLVGEYERTSIQNVRVLQMFYFCVLVKERCLASLENSKAVEVGGRQPVSVVLVSARRGVPAWVLEAEAAASKWARGSVGSQDREEEGFEEGELEDEI